jgi:hypothetical protein
MPSASYSSSCSLAGSDNLSSSVCLRFCVRFRGAATNGAPGLRGVACVNAGGRALPRFDWAGAGEG